MRIDRLTSKLQLALSDAQSLAVGHDHPAIEPVHLLSALLEQQGGSIKPLLMQVGFDIAALRSGLNKELDALPKIQSPTGDVNLSQDLARLLNQADRLAQQKGDQFISSELVLLAAMDENTRLGKLLLGQGVSRKALENAVANLRGGEAVNDPNVEESRQALDKYTVDMTKRAEENEDEDFEPPDVIENGAIDFGALTTEFLALSLDPYPKKSGAAFKGAGDPPPARISPFDALKVLKKEGET